MDHPVNPDHDPITHEEISQVVGSADRMAEGFVGLGQELVKVNTRLTKEHKYLRVTIAAGVLITVLLVVSSLLLLRQNHQADQNRRQIQVNAATAIYQQCQAGNEQRAELRTLIQYIVASSKPSPEVTAFAQRADSIFAQRNCENNALGPINHSATTTTT